MTAAGITIAVLGAAGIVTITAVLRPRRRRRETPMGPRHPDRGYELTLADKQAWAALEGTLAETGGEQT